MSFSRKSLINDVSDLVHDQLIGLVSLNDHLALLDTINVVIRKDFIQNVITKKKVILLSGGGSGHEPSHAGLVGDGLLTAVVFGNIFASPPANLILSTIRKLLTEQSDAQVLMIVPNYTGDRLNFGLAQEKALKEGFNLDSFVFGDDVAFGNQESKSGKRGLAGIFFIHKLAGALASQGKNLQYIKKKLKLYSSKIATISISSSACTIPAIGLSFNLPKDKLEIGLGIHGERGVKQIPHSSVSSIIPEMMSYLIEYFKFIKNQLSIEQDSTIPIALLINNLGGLSSMEVYIITKEIINFLIQKQFKIERIFNVSFMTSFDMAGVSVSIMILNQECLQLLDEPCCSACFTKNKSLNFNFNSSIWFKTKQQTKQITFEPIAYFENHEKTFFECVKAVCLVLIKNEKLLNLLDSETGDSDCGTTLALGASNILDLLTTKNLKPSLIQIAHQIENVMGGSSGALYSLLLTGADKCLKNFQFGNYLEANILIWIETLKSSINLVTKYSYAQVGDRTMIDTLNAVLKTLEQFKSSPLSIVIEQVVKNSKDAAEQTALMKPKIGRASYSDCKEINKPDPGAFAVYLWIEAICKELVKL